MDQSSSQHDNCQVGDMHTYCWDLVHFHTPTHHSYHHLFHDSFHHGAMIPWPFHSRSQLSFIYSYHCTWTGIHSHFVLVYLVSLGVGLKKWVVRPLGNWRSGLSGPWSIFWVRELLGNWFLKVLNCSYSALRLSVRPVVEALEGKWGSQGTVE